MLGDLQPGCDVFVAVSVNLKDVSLMPLSSYPDICKWGGALSGHISLLLLFGLIGWEITIHITDRSLGRITPNSDDRQDISVFDCGSGSNMELDISRHLVEL